MLLQVSKFNPSLFHFNSHFSNPPHSLSNHSQSRSFALFGGKKQRNNNVVVKRRHSFTPVTVVMSSSSTDIFVMVNGCSVKTGKAVIMVADSAGLKVLPVLFGAVEEAGKNVEVCGKEFLIHGPTDRESVLVSIYNEHPNLIVVDCAVPSAVNGTMYHHQNVCAYYLFVIHG